MITLTITPATQMAAISDAIPHSDMLLHAKDIITDAAAQYLAS